MELWEGLAKQSFWSKAAVLAIAAYIGVCVISIGVSLNAAVQWGSLTPKAADIFALSLSMVLLLFLASAVAVGIWIYRAHANLTLAGHTGLEFTPGWSVGWFFVPFANLVMPFRAMRELWERSSAEQASRWGNVLPMWWGSFLIGGIAENIGSNMLESPTASGSSAIVLAIGMAGRVVSAGLLLVIIRTVTQAQNTAGSVSDTFA